MYYSLSVSDKSHSYYLLLSYSYYPYLSRKRAKARGISVEVVHNTSVMGAVASCGLQLYQFGYTVSIPLFEGRRERVCVCVCVCACVCVCVCVPIPLFEGW